jgi:hypothetical protein
MDGGYGHKGRETLRQALRTELAARGRGREVRIMETRCLGLCPKKAVTAINAGAPGVIVTVPRKTAPDAALDLILSPVPDPGSRDEASRVGG